MGDHFESSVLPIACFEFGTGVWLAFGGKFVGEHAEAADRVWRVDECGYFEVHEEASHIHVGGADTGDVAIYEEEFPVEDALVVEEDLGACSVEGAEVWTACEVEKSVVGAERDDEPYAAPGVEFGEKGAQQNFVRDEIGRDEGDLLAALLDERDKVFPDGVGGLIGATADDLGADGARGARLEAEEFPIECGRLAAGEAPVAQENARQIGHGRPIDADAEIAKSFFVWAWADVFCRQILAANDGALSIEDGHFSVVAEVGRAARGERQNGHETLDGAARVEEWAANSQTRSKAANGIHEEAYLNAGVGASSEHLDDGTPDDVAAQTIGSDVNGVFRYGDLVAQSLPCGGAVGIVEDGDGVAELGCARGDGGHGRPLGVAVCEVIFLVGEDAREGVDGALGGDGASVFSPADEEEEENAEDGENENEERPCHDVALAPALANHACPDEESQNEAQGILPVGDHDSLKDVEPVVHRIKGKAVFLEKKSCQTGVFVDCPQLVFFIGGYSSVG